MSTTVTGTTAAASAAGSAATKSVTGAAGLGKNDFMKLLIAQLKNQDPMKPMEDKEFITQLAQFNSLEMLQNLNTQLETMATAQTMGQAAAMIGKHVEATLADGSKLSGVVSGVTFEAGTPRLLVGDKQLELSRITSMSA